MTKRVKVWMVVVPMVLGAVIFGCAAFLLMRIFGQPNEAEFAEAVQQQKLAHVPSGFMVRRPLLLSRANFVGLKVADIITKYNDLPVTNDQTYYTAVNRNLAGKGGWVTLNVMRAGKPIQITVPAGLLGFEGRNWNPFIDDLVDLLQHDRLNEATSFMAHADFSVLPEEQLLLARILLLPENDSTQDAQREEFIRRLMPLLAQPDFAVVGEQCLAAHRFKAAQPFFLKDIETDPTDISSKENLGLSYAQAGQFDEAGRVVDDIVANHAPDLTERGWHVLLGTRAEVYENRQNYAAAAADYKKAIELVPDDNDTDLRLRYLLSLARMNNIEGFEEGVAFCNKYPTKSYLVRPYDVDALRAYLLVRNRDEVRARAAVERWRNDSDAQKWFPYYWSDVPNASDVVDTWNRLMQ